VVNADGSNLTRLDAFGVASSPSWSRDGSKVVFVSNRSGQSAFYTANIDGTGITQVPSTGPADSDPSWSPDGTRIVFARTLDGNAVYVMDADGSNQTRLTIGSGWDPGPAWG
jgi:TolB protein